MKIKEKYFYSFYIPTCYDCKKNRLPSCDYECNYWKKVYSLVDIPTELFMNNEYRKHLLHTPKKKWYGF